MSIAPLSFTTPVSHPKGWGEELWVVNNDDYCAKLLHFKNGARFSMHYHWEKREHWFVAKGRLLLRYYDLTNATQKEREIGLGEVVGIPAGNPHQLIALEDSTIFEVSTTHSEEDSYRVLPGDSQGTIISKTI